MKNLHDHGSIVEAMRLLKHDAWYDAIRCGGCGDDHPNMNTIEGTTLMLCPRCQEEIRYERQINHGDFELNGTTLILIASKDKMFTCSECGTRVVNGKGRTFCRTCYDKRQREIHG